MPTTTTTFGFLGFFLSRPQSLSVCLSLRLSVCLSVWKCQVLQTWKWGRWGRSAQRLASPCTPPAGSWASRSVGRSRESLTLQRKSITVSMVLWLTWRHPKYRGTQVLPGWTVWDKAPSKGRTKSQYTDRVCVAVYPTIFVQDLQRSRHNFSVFQD